MNDAHFGAPVLARDLVAEFGPSGFSLAEAARRAGVSAAAPYRHFTDRQALMGELARQGFAKLAIGLHEAWNDGQPDPPTAFQRMGAAYVTFATEDPAAFAAMFESGGGTAPEPAMKDAAERTFAILVAAAGRLGARQAGDLPADPRRIAFGQRIAEFFYNILMFGRSGRFLLRHLARQDEIRQGLVELCFRWRICVGFGPNDRLLEQSLSGVAQLFDQIIR